MQKRKDVSTRGFAPIFKKDALQFALKWPEPMLAHKSWIEMIEICAASPGVLNQHFRVNFALAYAAEPDLAAALLNFLRGKWRNLEKSKAGKLKRFLSQNTAVKWERGFAGKPDRLGYISLWELQDGEIALAFEHSPGGVAVTSEDVLKARKWAKRNQDAGKKFAQKVFDENGNLHVRGKSRRRK